jgi:choline dehydrogenase
MLTAVTSQAILGTASSVDYVIVGAGTCGLIVASLLSENPNVTVAVVEPGEDTRNNPNITDPDNLIVPFGTSIDWDYPSTAQLAAANRSLSFHSGNAIGGTSTINGMTYIRADAAEIDAWKALGNEGWNWNTLLPYYKQTEYFKPPTRVQEHVSASFEPQYHRNYGDLHVGFRFALSNGSFGELVQTAWENIGYLVNLDVNGGDSHGFDV